MLGPMMTLFITTYSAKFTVEIVKIDKEYVGYYQATWAGCYTFGSFIVGALTKKISSAYV
jgi:hypothetical protein